MPTNGLVYTGNMKRDAQSTRQRILDAATAEFALYGIAGARVDRIAAASGSNKSMIYAYYTSKDQLFDAVFDAIIVRNMHDVPVDAHDLPEYAARLFDQWRTYPEILRLGTWDWLERGAEGMRIEAVVAANEHKIDEIRKAQHEGVVSARFPAATLLELIVAITQTRPGAPDGQADWADSSRRRQAIKDAVSNLIRD